MEIPFDELCEVTSDRQDEDSQYWLVSGAIGRGVGWQYRFALMDGLDAGLKGLERYIRPPHRPEGHSEVYQLYLATATRRDELLSFLVAHGIEAKVHNPIPIHLQNAARDLGY